VLFYHFERFVAECEERFEKAYGYFRPIFTEVALMAAEERAEYF